MVRPSTRRAAQQKSTAVQSGALAEKKEALSVSEVRVEAEVNASGRIAVAVATSKVSKRKVASREPDVDGGDVENADPADPADADADEAPADKPAAPKRRKTAATKKTDDMMPLAARTPVASLKRAVYIGAHVSAAGGVHNAVQNAAHIGANAFALFLKSQRKWASPPLAEEAAAQFRAAVADLDYDARRHVVPHGSYLVNLAQADDAKAAQAFDSFLDDLRRCEALGIALYNFHPGSTGGASRASACARIAAQLNRAHRATSSVVTLLENMCGSGNVVGSRFEELRDIIALVDDKARVGVCLDTCHAFAAGYDLRTPAALARTVAEFDAAVGLRYLRALHINDSKAPLGSHRDLHANVGTGFLGLRAFHNVVNHPALQGLPMVLETPIEEQGPDGKTVENKQIWADEIKLLESLVGMDVESDEFRDREAALQAKGAAERQRIQEQVDKKAEKDAKKGAKGQGKASGTKKKKKNKKKDPDDSCDSCGESD